MFDKLTKFKESVLQRWEVFTGQKSKAKEVQTLAAKPKTPNRNGRGGGK